MNNGHFAGIVQADGDDQGVRQASNTALFKVVAQNLKRQSTAEAIATARWDHLKPEENIGVLPIRRSIYDEVFMVRFVPPGLGFSRRGSSYSRQRVYMHACKQRYITNLSRLRPSKRRWNPKSRALCTPFIRSRRKKSKNSGGSKVCRVDVVVLRRTRPCVVVKCFRARQSETEGLGRTCIARIFCRWGRGEERDNIPNCLSSSRRRNEMAKISRALSCTIHPCFSTLNDS